MRIKLLLITAVALLLFTFSCSVKPESNFTYSPQEPKVGETVVFINTSIEGVRFNWRFGDGLYSTDESPEHQYNFEGTYVVELAAQNGVKSDIKTATIKILP